MLDRWIGQEAARCIGFVEVAVGLQSTLLTEMDPSWSRDMGVKMTVQGVCTQLAGIV